ncbi:MAG: LysM peptidoglycan-binding domain-containing protein [Epulopiscium sp.]|nr:LysM peptidoglycan-binding domain-containing protein [Candidatus Epulonipiscium sp.]
MKKYFFIKNTKRFISTLVLFLFISQALFGLIWGIPNVRGASVPSTTTYFHSIQIQEGDNLWNLAQRYKSEKEDIREYIKRIQKLNQLNGNHIYIGEYLILPIEVVAH